MGYETISYCTNIGVGVITLNRPERRNAMDTVLVEEITLALGEIAADDDVSVVIIRGGDRWFSVGCDVGDPATDVSVFLDKLRTANSRIETLGRPVIAAINGYCLGEGLELALACDLRVAGEDAIFSLPSVRFGMLAVAGGTQRLPRLIGVAKAKKMHFTGESIDAAEAYRIGLVNRVVPSKRVLEEAQRLADVLSDCSRSALGMGKYLIDSGMKMDVATALDFEAGVSKGLFRRPTSVE